MIERRLKKEYRRQTAKAERERQRKEDEKDGTFEWTTEPTSTGLEPPPSLIEEREAELRENPEKYGS